MSSKKVFVSDLVDEYSVRAKNFGDHSSFEFLGVSNEDGITKSKNAAKDKVEDYKIIEQGCFAYNPYRINVGSIAYLDEDIKGFISPAYVVFKTKPKSIIPELLFKFLKSKEGLRQIKLYARGTVRQALRFEDLCKIELTIPHYDEQVKLFEKISLTENETIKLNNETDFQLSIVSQLRQAFLREAMQGKLVPQDKNDEPASELLKKIKTEKEKLIVEGKLKKQKPLPEIKPEEIPYEIPGSWSWCRLGELFQIVRGSSPRPKGDSKYFSRLRTNFHWITIADFAKHSKDNVLQDTDQFLTEEGSKFSRFVMQNDLLIASSGVGSVGKSSRLGIKGFIYDGLMAIKNVNNDTLREFMLFYLKMKELEIYSIASGTNWLNINTEILNNYLFCLPPLTEQQRIVSKLEQLMQLCSELEKNINQSKEETNLLLQTVLREALEEKEKQSE